MADNIKYRFIQNVGDYFPSGYFSDDFQDKVQKCAGIDNDEIKDICTPFVRLKQEYNEYKNFIINDHPRVEDAIKKTHEFHTSLLKILGYETDHAYQEHCIVNDESTPIEMIPVRHVLRQGQQVKMLVMEMQNLITIDDKEPAGLFEQQYESEERVSGQQKYSARQWRYVFELDSEKYKISPAIINKAITHIFLLPEERRPHFILMLAGNTVFLFDNEKWAKGSYLQFSLDDLFTQASIDQKHRSLYALFHMLVSKHTLAAEGEMVLMDTIIEESYKNAYEVTKDLKEGVILAVETLANEALYWWKQNNNIPVSDYTDDKFEGEVKDDCLTIIYRLLFLFYAESRDELEILPVDDEVYKFGYSLESLRDLEMVRLNSEEGRNGYFFDDSIRHLFNLLSDGHNAAEGRYSKSFRVRPIDSPLFNNKNLSHLADVRIRNIKWQEIIKALSLSKKKNYCGRISYANLGVNQLGSVYESLLAYRGFYAEEDYIEVHKANEPQDGTFLVPYSRMGDFDISEVLTNQETGEPVILPEGTFVYRLNGRDRQKSASYYTPEVLTRSTVKYTLKSILDEVRANKRNATELLELKILEPAMGAAAFQNEVINQLAEAYLAEQQRQQRERGLKNWRISPDRYRDELQKVKAYIVTHNVYGVDLNPTAIELGKLSLWLNVIHKDMETPFFANRLAVGNAVIGAWLKVYDKKEIYAIYERQGARPKQNKWWEKAPHKVKFFSNRVKRSVNEVYHFLLPDANMLGVRSIKEQKKTHPIEDNRMATILKDWTAPIIADDFTTLQRISAKIDILLKEYFIDQISIDKYTNNRKEIWDGIDHSANPDLFKEELQAESYAKKQELFDTRYRHDNAYRKLKLAMDYWCALWFWEYDDAASLPTRKEYWLDIEALLDVDNNALDNRTRQALNRAGSDIVSEDAEEYGRMTEEESQIVTRTQEEILTGTHVATTLFADEEPLRLKIADRLAKRYQFFHPMLEFIEVFWLRDGFDVICGNPPWLPIQFKDVNVMSEKYPEVVIRKTTAPQVRALKNRFFESSVQKNIYVAEEVESECTKTFIGTINNYPLLSGQKPDLYKAVLENSLSLLSSSGSCGLVHPESVYDDMNGQVLRKELYRRLRFHFQFFNELKLFSEVPHDQKFGLHIYSSVQDKVNFYSMHNLYHPSTIDGSFVHSGLTDCKGYKVNGSWNTESHKSRVVKFTDEELSLLSKLIGENESSDSVKLICVHSTQIIDVYRSLSTFNHHVYDYKFFVSQGLNETTAVDNGIMSKQTFVPNKEHYEMVFSGPHIFVGNPAYKTPRHVCEINSDYDTIIPSIGTPLIRANFKPLLNILEYKDLITGLEIDGVKWIDDYRVVFRKMLKQARERTLVPTVIPPKSSHTGSLISVEFENHDILVEFLGIVSSVVLDFFMKSIGAQNLYEDRLSAFPLGIADKYKSALFARTLMLNCISEEYASLWESTWSEDYKNESWSISDKRLKSFSKLHNQWDKECPLLNFYERRYALVEIDVIVAMALGLSLKELELLYSIEFPIMQQYEEDTYYDALGNIVFTNSSGLKGVGLDRKYNNKSQELGWEDIRGEQIDENTYAGTAPTHTQNIDPAKSELYGGQQQTFVAPYTRCDRIADYRTAWAHFEKLFNLK